MMDTPAGLTAFVHNNANYVNALAGTSFLAPSGDTANCYILPYPS
ncbi:hypothetical protein [Corallococcus exercitus]